MAVSMAMPWHEGEERMHRLMNVPEQDNPTASMLTPQAANMLQVGPLIAVGALDSEMRPWTTLWGGGPGLSEPLGRSIIGIKAVVDRKNDPVVDILFGGKPDGEVIREEGEGRMVAALTIDLRTRKRVKIYGRMVAGAVSSVNSVDADEESNDEPGTTQSQAQLILRVDQSLGNCPKYLNSKQISPANVSSTLVFDSPDLTEEAANVVRHSDLFFVSSSHNTDDMDANHRGGPVGFVRAFKEDSGEWELVWPEYSGNRLYQTLGNFQATPQAGLVFPVFETGDVLYVTGHTEVLIGPDAARVLTHSNLAVKVTVKAARFVRQGLPFRGIPGEPSPYNPKVRFLASEAESMVPVGQSAQSNTAKLLTKTQLTPTVARYRFKLKNPSDWKAGQWVVFDFSHELDIGYSHMRDDDPLSINDDFIRTFTVSSPPPPLDKRPADEFEITVRKVGPVTTFLSRHRGNTGLEVSMLGFNGDVNVEQESDGSITPFVIAGVGYTPLLARLPNLDLEHLKIFYTLHIEDLDLVGDLLTQCPGAGRCLSIFLTGSNEQKLARKQNTMDQIRPLVASLEVRRLQKEDLDVPGSSKKWFACVSPMMKKTLVEWLPGKEIINDDFNF